MKKNKVEVCDKSYIKVISISSHVYFYTVTTVRHKEKTISAQNHHKIIQKKYKNSILYVTLLWSLSSRYERQNFS